MKLIVINGLPYVLLGFVLDYFLLGLSRKIKLPDFLAHLFTGLILGAMYSWFPFQIPLSESYGTVPPPQLNKLFQLGIFSFFFLYAIHYDFRLLRMAREERNWVAPTLFAGILLTMLIPVGWYFFGFSPLEPAFYLLPLALLGADLASLITGKFFTHEQIRARFGHRISFSFILETAVLLGIVILGIIFQVQYTPPSQSDLLFLGGALVLFFFLYSDFSRGFRLKFLQGFPLSFPTLAISIVFLYFAVRFRLPASICGLLTGLLVGEILRANQVKFWGTIFKPFRLLVIFPLWGLGTLLLNPLPGRWNFLVTGSILIFIIFLLSAFGVGFLWLKEKKEFLVPSLTLLNRGEFTLLLLLEGYLLHWISRDILIIVALVSVFWILLARTGLISKLDHYLNHA